MEEDMKDEMRVKKEIEELNLKYQIEMGIKKIAKEKQRSP